MTYTFKISRRMASNHRRGAILFGLTLLLTACGGSSPTSPSPAGPTPAAVPGWLTVELETPNSDDGAVQLRFAGPNIDSVVTDSRYNGVGQTAYGSADLIFTGYIIDGKVARFLVPDVNKSSQYSIRVIAAAQRNSWELQSVSAYRASIVR